MPAENTLGIAEDTTTARTSSASRTSASNTCLYCFQNLVTAVLGHTPFVWICVHTHSTDIALTGFLNGRQLTEVYTHSSDSPGHLDVKDMRRRLRYLQHLSGK